MDLVWSLCGIEALLGESDQSRRLITDKIILLLPSEGGSVSIESIRRSVRETYDYRSRMLHGNRNIVSRRREFVDSEPRKYLDEENQATAQAVAILSQLILYCYSHQRTEIETKLELVRE